MFPMSKAGATSSRRVTGVPFALNHSSTHDGVKATARRAVSERTR